MFRFEASDDVGMSWQGWYCRVNFCNGVDWKKEEIFFMECQRTPAVNIWLSCINSRAHVLRPRRASALYHSRFLYINFVTDLRASFSNYVIYFVQTFWLDKMKFTRNNDYYLSHTHCHVLNLRVVIKFVQKLPISRLLYVIYRYLLLEFSKRLK